MIGAWYKIRPLERIPELTKNLCLLDIVSSIIPRHSKHPVLDLEALQHQLEGLIQSLAGVWLGDLNNVSNKRCDATLRLKVCDESS